MVSENTMNDMTEDQKPKPTGKEPVEDQNTFQGEKTENSTNSGIQEIPEDTVTGSPDQTDPVKEENPETSHPDENETNDEGNDSNQEILTVAENKMEAEEGEDTTNEISDTNPALPDEEPAEGPADEIIEETEEEITEEKEEDSPSIPPGKIDYSILSKAQLIKEFEFLLESKQVNAIRNEVENLKINFYKKHKIEVEKNRKQFYEEGGSVEDFQAGEDEFELKFKELYKKYRHLKALHNRDQEEQRHTNLLEKQKILEELKELVSRKEDVNQTFQEFRELQKKWHTTGMVPQQAVKDLWENYHLYVEQFYDHIKINKELRDLDLKKNLEAKISLCEKAEELLLDPSVINAFRVLQKYHDQWREIGPVPHDQREVIWERFKEVTHQINKKHQEHFDNLRETQKKNLEAKEVICEKAEVLSTAEFKNLQEMDRLTKDMLELQRMWKTIGFAPKKDNNKIYQRFRAACDAFFSRKREYNTLNREVMNENLQKKLDLCIQAEGLQESTDWKSTTDELISLQKKWKDIGPVPRRHYDSLWKRFRQACDHFFQKKSDYFSNIDTKYEDNLKKKLELIDRIEKFKAPENVNEALNKLKEFQREWADIGFVPIKSKEEIQKKYRAVLDRHFENLKLDDHRKNMLRFKNKMEGLSSKQNALNKISFERDKFLNKMRQLEADIVLWENNIGFFAKSKNADAMVREFRQKIEQGKLQIKLLEEKINLIDEMDARK